MKDNSFCLPFHHWIDVSYRRNSLFDQCWYVSQVVGEVRAFLIAFFVLRVYLIYAVLVKNSELFDALVFLYSIDYFGIRSHYCNSNEASFSLFYPFGQF